MFPLLVFRTFPQFNSMVALGVLFVTNKEISRHVAFVASNKTI
jgi:hypothetical protein